MTFSQILRKLERIINKKLLFPFEKVKMIRTKIIARLEAGLSKKALPKRTHDKGRIKK